MNKVKSYDDIINESQKESIIKDYVENLLSLREIGKKYNIKCSDWLRKIIGNKIRNSSEANKIAHMKYPEKFKLSNSTKTKMRAARLKWMKEHPEKTAWRLKNMSYPEKCFKKMIEDNGLDKKYLIYREYPVFPYFIDFAFINEKVAVEIDGSQHLKEDRKKKDEEKDALLISQGWKILRIAATEVIHGNAKILPSLLEILSCGSNMTYTRVGILKAPKSHEKVSRGDDGLSEKQRIAGIKQRRVERPLKDELWELVKEKSFLEIGRKYGVTDNAIRKWCKQYGLPYRKKDIDVLMGKEHKYSKEKHICLECGKEYYTDKHRSRFCSDKCYKTYIKNNGLLNKEQRKKSYNWIFKENTDGSFANKRVTSEKLIYYINNGWSRGNKLK